MVFFFIYIYMVERALVTRWRCGNAVADMGRLGGRQEVGLGGNGMKALAPCDSVEIILKPIHWPLQQERHEKRQRNKKRLFASSPRGSRPFDSPRLNNLYIVGMCGIFYTRFGPSTSAASQISDFGIWKRAAH